MGFTAMTTGMVKGSPGRTAVGGVVSKDRVNSRPAIFSLLEAVDGKRAHRYIRFKAPWSGFV
jgi:hypothetical protein